MEEQVSPQNIEQQEDYVTIKELFSVCVKNWYWFAISVLFCLVIGAYVVLSTPATYERTAQVLVKDDLKGRQIGNEITSTFSDLGIVTAGSDIYNEVFVIKSPIIMEKVVNRLHLNVSYSRPGMFKDNTLYGVSLPLEMEFVDMPEGETYTLKAFKAEGDNTVTLSDFVKYEGANEIEYDKDVTFDVNKVDTLATPIGRVVIRPNAKFGGDLADEIKMNVSATSVHAMADAILEGLTSEMAEEHASIINLKYTDTSISRAEDIINTLIEEYNNSWVDARNEVAKATSKFINERLLVIEQELGTVDNDISSFKSENLLPDVDAVSSMYLSRSAKVDDEIMELNNKLQMAIYVSDFMSNPAHKYDVLPANTGIGEGNIEMQIADYNKMVLERQKLLAMSSESNPLVKDYDIKINGGHKTILEAVQNQVIALEKSIANYKNSRSQFDSKIAANPNQSKYLLSVERQQKIKESLYLFLLQKREENELSQTFTPYNTRIISYARGTSVPVAPKKMNIILVAFLLGVIIPFGVIFVRETTNTTVRNKRDIEKLTVPYCGQIPLIGISSSIIGRIVDSLRLKKDKEFGIVIKEGYNNGVGEAFRVVRSNLSRLAMSYGLNESSRVIMVTSLHSASGKTFSVANLAAAYAIKGKRVVMVDMDLRRHTLSDKLGYTSAKGLSNILVGHSSVNDVLVKDVDGMRNLSIIPAGPVPPNPTEIIDSPKLKDVLDQLKSEYDIVFIDCPPSEIVADTSIIAPYADMTLFIIRVGRLERALLPDVQKYYDEGKFNKMAIVLNGSVDTQASGYGYGYGYGYGQRKNK